MDDALHKMTHFLHVAKKSPGTREAYKQLAGVLNLLLLTWKNREGNLENSEIVPDTLLNSLQTSMREPIETYNEEIRYVGGELEKQLHALVGEEYWPHFRSSFETIIDHQRGKQLTVGDYLLGLGAYGSIVGPQDQWYDALCTALYRCKKFEKIGKPKPSTFMPPPRREFVYLKHGPTYVCSPQAYPVAKIKRQDQDDLIVVLSDEVMRFAQEVYQQLSQTRFSELVRIDELKKRAEASLG
jgi:hypothetical protein